MGSIVFIFLDGFGLASAGPDNPLSWHGWPKLGARLGAAPVAGEEVQEEGRLLVALDCSLGVEGLPQSATGQVALLCGINAPALLGYHLAAYPNGRLKQVIDTDNVLKHVTAAGLRATFANAYTPEYFEAVVAGTHRHSATTLCVLAAGLRFRMVDDLLRGEAVCWDITNNRLRQRPGYEQVPVVTPEEAGQRLAHLALSHHLVLFESFLSDVVGHSKDRSAANELVQVLDAFIAACAAALSPDSTLLVSSDHGNLEDLSTGAHTRNPVPLIAIGPATHHFTGVHDITEVVPAIYRAFALGS
ncbi:MAG: hypothetical protein ACUVWR_04830 [Anaerolineae bacterium]